MAGSNWDEEYRSRHIKGPATHLLWGYQSLEAMQDSNAISRTGLQFVKAQLIPRAGIEFSDLLLVLQTQFVNKIYATPRSTFILESIKADYGFLQSLVKSDKKAPSDRYKDVADHLVRSELPRLDRSIGLTEDDLRSWAMNDFENCGKMIVLHAEDALTKKMASEQLARTDISNLRLLHLDGSLLLEEEWRRLDCFIRIWRRLGWSISDIDLALETLEDLEGRSEENAKQTLSPGTIEQLAAVVQLLQITNLPLEELLTFWAPIPARGRDSLYHKLFLRHRARGVNDVFWPDAFGNLFANTTSPISEHRLEIMAAFGITSTDLDAIFETETTESAGTVTGTLDIENLSAIYRRTLAARVLGIEVGQFDHFATTCGDVFESPADCVAILRIWKRLSSLGFTWDDIKLLVSATSESNIPVPLAKQAFDLCRQVSDGVQDIHDQHPIIHEENQANHARAKANASALFHESIVGGILGLITGSTTYTARVPVIQTEYFSHRVAEALPGQNLVYRLLETEDWEASNTQTRAELQFHGILTAKEIDLIKGLIKGTTNASYSSSAQPVVTLEQAREWENAIDLAAKQPQLFYEEKIAPVLPHPIDTILLAPDAILGRSEAGERRTPTQKTLAFLQSTALVLRQRLAKEAVENLLTEATDFSDKSVLTTLLGEKQHDGRILDWVLQNFGVDDNVWSGWVAPKADGEVRFVIDKNLKPDSVLFNRSVNFVLSDGGNGKVWESEPLNVEANKPYFLQFPRSMRTRLQWKDGENIDQIPECTSIAWRGYFRASCTAKISFLISMRKKPLSIWFDGQEMEFVRQQGDSNAIWRLEDEISVSEGSLYNLEMVGMLPTQLKWKSANTPPSIISQESLVEEKRLIIAVHILRILKKAATVLNRIPLSPAEIKYVASHSADLGGFRFWQRNNSPHVLEALCNFFTVKQSIPQKNGVSLVDVLIAAETGHVEEARSQLSDLTGWTRGQIEQVQLCANFSLSSEDDFKSFKTLAKFHRAISLANKLGAPLPRLFDWANISAPGDLFKQFEASRGVQSLAHSRMERASWIEALRLINDKLRESQKKALINYLLVQEPFVSESIIDADRLSEYFLIDVQTTPLVQTTRIKQAIATVQLFIQRCFLSLEPDVPPNGLDRSRWKWMQRYQTWEANRKVFLYPENWIEPSIRDNKTEFFKELETALLQKDLAPEAIQAALRSYLSSLDTVSRLQCIALFVDNTGGDRIHVFARTLAAPFKFYYNNYLPSGVNGVWKGWETMHVDIPTYAIGESGFVGNYLAPAIYQGRLLLFIGQFTKSHIIQQPPTSTQSTTKAGWKIELGWSEYRDGKWTPRQTCPDAFIDGPLEDAAWAKMQKWRSRVTKVRDKAKESLATAVGEYDEAVKSKGPANLVASRRKECDMWRSRLIAIDREEKRLLATINPPDGCPPIDGYSFRPVVIQQDDRRKAPIANTGIRIYLAQSFDHSSNLLNGVWLFNGSHLLREDDPSSPFPKALPSGFYTFGNTIFEHNSGAAIFRSQQTKEVPVGLNWRLQDAASVDYSVDDTNRYLPNLFLREDSTGPRICLGRNSSTDRELFSQPFYYEHSHELAVAANGHEARGIFETLAKVTTATPRQFKLSYGPVGDEPNKAVSFNDCQSLYSLYNWELGLHAPMIMIERLFKAQQFENALAVCHYVFNPLKSGSAGDVSRFWEFPPFKNIGSDSIEPYFLHLKAATPDAFITRWREKPFHPHVVARGRPMAYMKWIVMKYIQILIAHGDILFRENTMESVHMATQHYVLASHLYGPRGQKVPRGTSSKRYTYNMLAAKFDAFANAIVQFEEGFPYYSPSSSGTEPKDIVASNIFGSVGSLLFAIPKSSELQLLADTIDDRLFKIRNSQDITGAFRQLSVSEPPIDPAAGRHGWAAALSHEE